MSNAVWLARTHAPSFALLTHSHPCSLCVRALASMTNVPTVPFPSPAAAAVVELLLVAAAAVAGEEKIRTLISPELKKTW